MNARGLVVIASPGLSAGFGLAGVPVFEAADGTHAAAQIERLAAEGSAGVVIIDEPLYRDLPEELLRSLRRSALPVVIPVPGPDWTTESTAHEYIVEILRRAIGYRVKLQ
jgi:vacuolar-type H+-ATPase subunit F/Vma7